MPKSHRIASEAPGHEEYQHKADYVIHPEMDDKTQRISGTETITYRNGSPDPLTYLWLQLDQNMRSKGSERKKPDAKGKRNRIYE